MEGFVRLGRAKPLVLYRSLNHTFWKFAFRPCGSKKTIFVLVPVAVNANTQNPVRGVREVSAHNRFRTGDRRWIQELVKNADGKQKGFRVHVVRERNDSVGQVYVEFISHDRISPSL